MKTLVSFDVTNGWGPAAGLVQGIDGNFYGTTEDGGTGSVCLTYVCGTVFRLTPQGTLTRLHTFSFLNGQNGVQPSAPVIQATDGNLYGTTAEGGIDGYGTVFKITPSGTFTLLHSFDGTDGKSVFDGLLQGTDGAFYAPTYLGGPSSGCGGNSCGTVFSLSVGLGPFVQTVPASGKVGTPVRILGTDLTDVTSVRFNGTAARYKVVSKTFIWASVPAGATTGFVTVTTSGKTLKSNVKFRVP